uniref:Uncharacterized protein n=1 Tax=Glossina palpalis gambiensis TaxID=67801 RepID=A0A1B0BBH9_9MUSC
MSAACFIAVAIFIVVVLVVIIHVTAVFLSRTKLGDVLIRTLKALLFTLTNILGITVNDNRRKFLSSQCSITITFSLAIRVALADNMSRYECLEAQLFDIFARNGCKVAPLHKNLDYLEEFKALAGKFSNCFKKIFKNPTVSRRSVREKLIG